MEEKMNYYILSVYTDTTLGSGILQYRTIIKSKSSIILGNDKEIGVLEEMGLAQPGYDNKFDLPYRIEIKKATNNFQEHIKNAIILLNKERKNINNLDRKKGRTESSLNSQKSKLETLLKKEIN